MIQLLQVDSVGQDTVSCDSPGGQKASKISTNTATFLLHWEGQKLSNFTLKLPVPEKLKETYFGK